MTHSDWATHLKQTRDYFVQAGVSPAGFHPLRRTDFTSVLEHCGICPTATDAQSLSAAVGLALACLVAGNKTVPCPSEFHGHVCDELSPPKLLSTVACVGVADFVIAALLGWPLCNPILKDLPSTGGLRPFIERAESEVWWKTDFCAKNYNGLLSKFVVGFRKDTVTHLLEETSTSLEVIVGEITQALCNPDRPAFQALSARVLYQKGNARRKMVRLLHHCLVAVWNPLELLRPRKGDPKKYSLEQFIERAVQGFVGNNRRIGFACGMLWDHLANPCCLCTVRLAVWQCPRCTEWRAGRCRPCSIMPDREKQEFKIVKNWIVSLHPDITCFQPREARKCPQCHQFFFTPVSAVGHVDKCPYCEHSSPQPKPGGAVKKSTQTVYVYTGRDVVESQSSEETLVLDSLFDALTEGTERAFRAADRALLPIIDGINTALQRAEMASDASAFEEGLKLLIGHWKQLQRFYADPLQRRAFKLEDLQNLIN